MTIADRIAPAHAMPPQVDVLFFVELLERFLAKAQRRMIADKAETCA